MIDNDIIKGLECVGGKIMSCRSCPYSLRFPMTKCRKQCAEDALDLINRQKAEIERLEERLKREAKCQYDLCGQIVDLKYMLPIARAEAVKEFAERLEKPILSQLGISTLEKSEAYHFCLDEIDNLVKEFTEGKADG